MKKEFKIIEIFNPDSKNIDERLKEVFIAFLIEKMAKSIEKSQK